MSERGLFAELRAATMNVPGPRAMTPSVPKTERREKALLAAGSISPNNGSFANYATLDAAIARALEAEPN